MFCASRSQLTISLGKHGELVSVCRNGLEFAMPAPEAFTLQLLDDQGNDLTLAASGFVFQDNVYTSCPAMPSLKVELQISCDENFIRFRPKVTGVPANYVLSWFDGPQVFYPRHNNIDLIYPVHDGVIISEPLPMKKYRPIGFAKRGSLYGNNYPGRAQMQFMALTRGNDGVYFAAHDPHGTTKAVEYENTDEYVRLSLQTFTGCSFGMDYAPDWDYVLGGFSGNWQSAAEIYRQWYENSYPLAGRAAYPEWMKKSPVILAYAVRGQGSDRGEMAPNCYYPYTNMLPWVDKFNAELEAPVMPLLMHWEGTAPWAPPLVWPPFGGTENFFAFRDELHKKGNLLGVYCSGTAWTCSSCIDRSYAPGCTPEQEKMMLRGPKGELEASVCNGEKSQRWGYDLCLTEEPARTIVREEILKLADAGIDYAQFYDQNHGGGLHNCFARDHHHPPVPGAWQVDVQRKFVQDVLAEIKKRNQNMILGCESSAADTYAEYLPLNDARSSFVTYRGVPIPLQQYVMHGRTANFAGNQCGSWWSCDFALSPYSLNRRLAYAFCAGDFLSVTLKEEGKAHWCWSYEWSNPEPDQKIFWQLLKNLNDCRRENPEFLLEGRMLSDLVKIQGESLFETDPEGRKRYYPCCYSSSWMSADGSKAVFAVNYLDCPQTLSCGEQTIELPGCSAMKLEYDSGKIKIYSK